MTKHKWIYQSGQIITHDQYGDPEIVLGKYAHIEEKLARRMVEEHNALAGIEDVESWMLTLKTFLNQAQEELSADPEFSGTEYYLEQALALFPDSKGGE